MSTIAINEICCDHINSGYPNDKAGKELGGDGGDVGAEQAQLLEVGLLLQEEGQELVRYCSQT